jgi:penicillin-binding protein 1C
MQVARLVEGEPTRNAAAKFRQIVHAQVLERTLSKADILTLYLTLAPYGGNLEGVRAASWAYFGREPDNLSPDQIAMLIALPQSPEARRPDLHPRAAVVARKRVLDRLAQQGVFAADLAAESNDYPAPKRRDFPALAWHASEEAVRRAHAAHLTGDIQTTLDMTLQKEMEALAKRAAGNSREGVQIAIVAVDIATRQVRAMVGSANRAAPGGWIDLTNRARSPGSTLKPFIYGLAFDDGVAAGGTRIADAPRRFASYRPEDFDRVFRGDVTITEALKHSLNVPAVEALDAVGARRFAATLSFAGADLSLPLDADDDVGLPVALGGAGMTVRDLAMLYAALGDGGQAKPLVWLKSEADTAEKHPPQPVQIMSAPSAREIIKILAGGPAPAGRMPAKLTQEAPEIAFKTGTSYGYRDAWSAGISDGYAVVVWTGRADGAPRAGVTGREGALPVLFDAFDAIARATPARSSGPSLRAPEDTERTPPAPMAHFDRDNQPPHILFPPNGAEVWSDDEHRDFVLAAEGRGKLTWYADGQPLGRNIAGQPVWRPAAPGFYTLAVVDAEGRTSKARVRIKTPGDE